MNNFITLKGAVASVPTAYTDKQGNQCYCFRMAVDSDYSTKRYYVTLFVKTPFPINVESLAIMDNIVVEGTASAGAYLNKVGDAVGVLNCNVTKIVVNK